MERVCMVIPGKENKQDGAFSIMLTKTQIVRAGVQIGLFAYSAESIFPFPHPQASVVPELLGELFESGGTNVRGGGGAKEHVEEGGVGAERVLLSGAMTERASWWDEALGVGFIGLNVGSY